MKRQLWLRPRAEFRIILSFSGPVSKALGAALFGWLKKISPSFAPFISGRDISAGSWNLQLLKALRNSDVCIACLIRENLDAEWIHFESRACWVCWCLLRIVG